MPILVRFVSWLGALGTVLCIAGGLGVWYVESRIDRAREQLFERVDKSLVRIDGRLVDVQRHIVESKITIDEIQQRARDLTKKEARDRLAAKFEVEARVQQLVAGLRQADMMLEVSREMVGQVRQLLEIGVELGFSLNADAVDPLLDRIAGIKEEFSSAIEIAERLGKRVGDDSDDESQGKRIEQVATIAARLLATFGDVDSRVAAFRVQLTSARDAIEQLNTKTHARIVTVAVCATLMLLWMAAGQFCLWLWARNNLFATQDFSRNRVAHFQQIRTTTDK